MRYNPKIHNRQSTRIKGFDYSSEGYYFITLNTQNREHLFGEIKNKRMYLNEAGRIAAKCWQEIPNHFPDAKIDEFVIMPDHTHGLIEIVSPDESCPYHTLLRSKNRALAEFKSPSRTIGSIVRGFKIGVTKWLRNNHPDEFPANRKIWQRNYHDSLILNSESLKKVRTYIKYNPRNWKG